METKLAELKIQIAQCRNCRLCETRNKTVPGEGPANAKIMLIGEAPGEVNDREGRPFVGHGGKILDKILAECELKRSDIYITNTLRCWPPKNRVPKKDELALCHQYLKSELEIIKPICIITLGATAYRVITGSTIKLREEHGTILRCNDWIVCPTFHPNALRYIKGGVQTLVADIRQAMAAAQISTSPQSNMLFEGTDFHV